MKDWLYDYADTLDLVLHLQLSTLQLHNPKVIGRRVRHRVRDFRLQRLMAPFKFRKMRLDGHMEWLLRQFAEHP